MTINTIRSKSFSGGGRWSTRPRSWKSAGPFSVANPGRTVLYGKKPLAKNATPASWNTEQTMTRMHSSRVFIRPTIPNRQCSSQRSNQSKVEDEGKSVVDRRGRWATFLNGESPGKARIPAAEPSLKLSNPLFDCRLFRQSE
jgi:hypothetical protein